MNLSILGLLGLLFVALKLVGVIGWSWWWVTAPFWGGALATFVTLTFAVLIGAWESKK